MELTQLRYFQAAANEQNFTRAAENLHISQPALSKGIQNLEKELGIELFIRDGNRITLSASGAIFLEDVNSALRYLTSGVQNIRTRTSADYGNISIAIDDSVAISHIIEDFLVDHPNVFFHESPTSTIDTETQLLNGRLNFVVSYAPINNPHLEWIPLYQDRMSVLMNKNHPLAEFKELRLEQLLGERLLQGDRFGLMDAVQFFRGTAPYSPKFFYEGTDKALVGRLISRAAGITFAPYSVTLAAWHRLSSQESVDQNMENVICIPLIDNFWHKTLGISAPKTYHNQQLSVELINRITEFYRALPPAY